MKSEHERAELLLGLVAEQAPALVSVGGKLYEGHIQSCLAGEVVAFARPYGTRENRQEYRWELKVIDDIGRQEAAGAEDGDEDPLMVTARELAAQAAEYDGLSLAERLIAERNRGEFHGRNR